MEYQAETPTAAGRAAAARREPACSSAAGSPAPAQLTADASGRAGLWHTRKGLYATVAGARPSGTTALLEDIVVPVPVLADTCAALTGLFDRHGYSDSVIFGHAKDGNIHFMLTERLRRRRTAGPLRSASPRTWSTSSWAKAARSRPSTAPAGSWRPYVRRQYGDELYEVMREIKRLCDPRGMLNPGVLIDRRPRRAPAPPQAAPTVEAEVDRCVECGYCEPVCPSKDLTITPRQRIVLRREMRARRAAATPRWSPSSSEDYEYDAVDTCAVDGMCQTACPVLINTGDLVKRLRRRRPASSADGAGTPRRSTGPGHARAASRR